MEEWRKAYAQFGCQWIEGEYLPCPGSVECSRAVKKGDDDKDEGPTYPIEVNYP